MTSNLLNTVGSRLRTFHFSVYAFGLRLNWIQVYTAFKTLPDRSLKVNQTMNVLFSKKVDYRTHRSENWSAKHNHTVLRNFSKMSKRITVQMKSHIFSTSDSVSILGFPFNFKLVCVTNSICHGAAIWLLYLSTKKSASSVLNTWMVSRHRDLTRMSSVGITTTLKTYPQFVHFLLQTYATNGNITDTEDAINMFNQPLNETPSRYAKKLVAKALQCIDVYEKHDLMKS